ncbi:hypothetical protein [Burkholderia sp. S171]|uniref:hypothetical protein n=1 Tax=Burkholderia sp. S171 TaxID=1641860 RepID=UPI00131C1BEE|nr:hypothetical protein [Burkholderia sp. S171]
MASKPKRRKTGRTTPPLTREMLLPMSAELASKVSLHNHLALVALRQGQGNADLVAELLKTVYVAYDLLDPDQLIPDAGHFARAEAAIKTLIKHAAVTDEWRLAAEECEGVELILGLYDVQLAALPKHRIEGAKQRLMRVLEKGSFPALSPPI